MDCIHELIYKIQWNLLDANFMQAHLFRLKFYAVNMFSMYLDKYHTQIWVSAGKMVIEIFPPLNPTVLALICNIFQIFFILLGALNVRL